MNFKNYDFKTVRLFNVSGSALSKCLFCVLAWLMVSTPASALVFGINLHQRNDAAISDIMRSRNFKAARIDLTIQDNPTAVRAQIARIKANGGTVRAVLVTSYERNYACSQDLGRVENDLYNETLTLVDRYKDVITDFELLNEVTLRPDTVREVPFNSAGTSTAPYQNKPCYRTLAVALRGMANAVTHTKVRTGLPLRVILTVVGRDFGFLTFMQQQQVHFDKVGFVIYPGYGQANLLTDAWYGTGGPFTQLAVFGRPVIISEFNCAEIYAYNGPYDNTNMNSSGVSNCFRSYQQHLPSFFNQNKVRIEAINIYELLDDTRKGAPENRFGLMWNLTNPKPHLSILGAFAGGSLTAAERQYIVNSGILTDAQINSYYAIRN